jgi:ATP-dependent protease ClpP protease subunit/flagellar biosynthesis/type III secretory pathway chaperone
MKQIFLTQEIDNDNNYIDSVVSQIKAIPDGEAFEMLITCEGGNVFQGARLQNAVLEHNGKTKATVIGLAASYAGVLLASFDEVDIDKDADLMLHKAHIPDVANEDITDEQAAMIARFNKRAYAQMASNGVDEELLKAVFLSEENENYWLNAKEAEALGIGKAVKIERRNSTPFKVAASLDISAIKEKFSNKNKLDTNMGLFDKPVMRTATLSDGRTVIFNSKKEVIQKGDKLTLVGSNDSLKGRVRLTDSLVAEISEGNIVDAIEEEEVPAAEVSEDQVAELTQKVADLEQAVAGILEKMGGSEEAEAEAKAELDEKEKEVEDKIEDLKEANAAAKALLENALEVSKTISTSYKVAKPEDKHEPVLNGLSASEAQAYSMRQVISNPKEQ